MLLQKLLIAADLTGAPLLGIAAPAEARGWDGGEFHYGPVYRGGFHRGPVHGGPAHRGPVYVAPSVYRPADRGVDRRNYEWHREQRPPRLPLLAASCRFRRPADAGPANCPPTAKAPDPCDAPAL